MNKQIADSTEKKHQLMNMSVADFHVLPEGCIANILSLTTPVDACRLSLVSSIFSSAANSDAVWERFLPPDYLSIISKSSRFEQLVSLPKKQLYLSLCAEPLLIDDGKKIFFLDRGSGKKCYMIAAGNLAIVWGDTSIYWGWASLSESRFDKVAVLRSVCWLQIDGKMDTSMLSLNTNYGAYMVFKLSQDFYGFEEQPVEVSVGTIGSERHKQNAFLYPKEGEINRQFLKQSAFLDHQDDLMGGQMIFENDYEYPVEEDVDGQFIPENEFEYPESEGGEESAMDALQWAPNDEFEHPEAEEEVIGEFDGVQNLEEEEIDGKFAERRKDGWLEVEMGDYLATGDDGELEMSLLEVVAGHWKSGLIIQGIELRPKAKL